jgi:hypothetical protein
MFPLEILRVDCNEFDVITPILNKGKKGTFSLVDSLFPLIFLQDLLKFMNVLLVLVFSLNKLIKVVFPVEQ